MSIKQGDTIGIIALSGDCEREKVESAKSFFEKLGYKVKLSDNIFDKKRYLAGDDEKKISELHSFYLSPEIKLILASRGGYGAIRLLNGIDYDLIKSNPKPLCGFSDVTALLLMIYKKTGHITYHTPMACTNFLKSAENGKLSFTQKKFFEVINQEKQVLKGDKLYNEGYSKGIIWGGNLSTVVSLCGLDFIPDKDFLFFTEDLNEPVYKIDKMFQQLLNIEKFKNNCKGIVLGDFLDVDNEVWLDDYFRELGEKLNIPISAGYKITHKGDMVSIPIGENAILEEKELVILPHKVCE